MSALENEYLNLMEEHENLKKYIQIGECNFKIGRAYNLIVKYNNVITIKKIRL